MDKKTTKAHVQQPEPRQESNQTIDIPHEVVDQAGNNLPVLTAKQKAEKAIQAFDVAQAYIDTKKKEAEDLKEAGITDKESLKKVEDHWREVRRKRLDTESLRKKLGEEQRVILNKINEFGGGLVDDLKEVEDITGKMLDEYEAKKKEEAEKEERAKQEELHRRVNELIENGIKLVDGFYSIGDTISVDVVSLKGMAQENYDGLLSKVKSINEEQLEKKRQDDEAEKKRLAAIEQQRLDNEAKEEELRKEREALENDVRNSRIEALQNIGLTHVTDSFFTFQIGENIVNFPFTDLGKYSSAYWKQLLEESKEIVADAKQKHEEQLKEAEALKTRIADRNNSFTILGFDLIHADEKTNIYSYQKNFNDTYFKFKATLSDDEIDWPKAVSEKKEQLAEWLEEQEEAKRVKETEEKTKQLLEQRSAELLNVGFSDFGISLILCSSHPGNEENSIHIAFDDLAEMPADEYSTFLVKSIKAKRGLEDYDTAKEKEIEQSQLDDAGKIKALLNDLEQAIANVNIPSFSNEKFNILTGQVLNQIKSSINELRFGNSLI